MKQGVVITVFVLMFAVVCTPLAAQDSGVNYQTYMVETFDSPESSEIAWNAIGSKFITEGYPILKTECRTLCGLCSPIPIKNTNF